MSALGRQRTIRAITRLTVLGGIPQLPALPCPSKYHSVLIGSSTLYKTIQHQIDQAFIGSVSLRVTPAEGAAVLENSITD